MSRKVHIALSNAWAWHERVAAEIYRVVKVVDRYISNIEINSRYVVDKKFRHN